MKEQITLYPVTYTEIKTALQNYGGFNSFQYDQIGQNVIICEGAIVVALKKLPTSAVTLYVIEGTELPLPEYRIEMLKTKKWASPQVIEDIRTATQILLKQLNFKTMNANQKIADLTELVRILKEDLSDAEKYIERMNARNAELQNLLNQMTAREEIARQQLTKTNDHFHNALTILGAKN